VAAEPERPRRPRPALGQVLVVGLRAVGRQGPQAPEAADPLDHRSVLQEVGTVDVVAGLDAGFCRRVTAFSGNGFSTPSSEASLATGDARHDSGLLPEGL
jgi:hypothetical protein